MDTTLTRRDSLLVRSIETVPLSNREEQAYATLDSTATLEKAFKPSGFLARFVDDEEENGGSGLNLREKVPGELKPAVKFNRVDALFAGLNYRIDLNKRLELQGSLGYSTGYDRFSYGIGATIGVVQKGKLKSDLRLAYLAETAASYRSRIYSTGMSTVTNLLGEPNYFDYFRSEGFRISNGYRIINTEWSGRFGFNSRDHRSLDVATAYDLLGRDNIPRVNPAVDEGRLNSVDITLGYNLDESYSFGVTEFKQIRLELETAQPGLGSDFEFTRYHAVMQWSFETFYRRRLLPNTLDLAITGGTYSGDLPQQKLGIIDGALGIFSPFGTLKTIRNRPYQGEDYWMIAAEHNFRTVPFELLGLNGLADRNLGLILFGAVGQTRVSDSREQRLLADQGYRFRETNGTHLEAGLSLNGLLGLFRVDFAARLDQPAFLVNLGVARIF